MVGMHPKLKTSWMEAILRNGRFKHEEEAAIEEARRLLRFVGLKGMGDQIAHNLPYGAQRRLELARALASEPKLLLLDEVHELNRLLGKFSLMAIVRTKDIPAFNLFLKKLLFKTGGQSIKETVSIVVLESKPHPPNYLPQLLEQGIIRFKAGHLA